MTTANALISRALRLIGVLGQGRRTLTANEADDGLMALNSLMDSFSIDNLMIYQTLEENFPLVVGTASYSIGSGGTFNTTRPVKITNAFIRDASNNDYPVEIVDNFAYDSVPLKTVTSRSRYLYYDAIYPLAYIRLLYVPAYAETLYINSWKQLQQFTDGTTALSLPPGYERLITYNLAVELHGEYRGDPLMPEVVAIAKESKAAVKKLNAQLPVADVSESMMVRAGRGKRNIYTG